MGTRYISALLIALSISLNLSAQKKSKGPIIKEYGAVWAIEQPDFKVDTTKTYRAVFDIMNSPESHDKVNASIETAARFLNMHAQSGVPAENLKAALVVHNQASKDIISDTAYQKRYGTANPNSELIKALQHAGVDIIFCGQSSNARGFPKEDLMEGVQLSLSAMTALIHLQDQEYRLIKF
ncbi:MAG: hypothetical protein Mars2KO_18440 [Maribacter sp.]